MFNLNHISTALVGFPIAVAVLVIAVTSIFEWVGKSGRKYPPGPKGIPFFGNLFQLSKQDFEEWGHKYGKANRISLAHPADAYGV